MPEAVRQIVWFKRDLRVVDHACLAEAAARGPAIPLYVVEPELWAQPDAAARQWAFVSECLTELQADLAALGQPLVIRVGDAVEILEAFRARFAVSTLWSHQETGNLWSYERDKRVADWARAHGIEWREPRQSGVIRRLKSRDGWAKAWDAEMAKPQAPTPRLAPIDGLDPGHPPSAREIGLAPDPCPDRQSGGRRLARATLESFLAARGAPYRRAMSAPEPGARHCSRISAHLAFGTLSMRETAQAAWTRQRELRAAGTKGGWAGSMRSFVGRLHWRDHFTQKLEDAPSMERRCLHAAYEGVRPEAPDPARLAAWRAGETGWPFVDACMRSLRATGWLNFRMRAMVMSVASYQLWLPWRASGEALARLFTDYEPGIHWPQTQMQSGVTGVNTVRIYNPIKQGRDHDPEGRFIRRWIPELAPVPDAHLHEPWTWDGADGLLGRAYPAPLVDLAAATKAAKDAIYAVRRGAAYRDAADAIQEKHGSRKSRLPMTGRRKTKASDTRQQSLDLGD